MFLFKRRRNHQPSRFLDFLILSSQNTFVIVEQFYLLRLQWPMVRQNLRQFIFEFVDEMTEQVCRLGPKRLSLFRQQVYFILFHNVALIWFSDFSLSLRISTWKQLSAKKNFFSLQILLGFNFTNNFDHFFFLLPKSFFLISWLWFSIFFFY